MTPSPTDTQIAQRSAWRELRSVDRHQSSRPEEMDRKKFKIRSVWEASLALYLGWIQAGWSNEIPPVSHWTEDNREIGSPLTDELKQQSVAFDTDRAAEADPDGICFGHFGSDEYWVIQYHADGQKVEARAWIIDIKWVGHRAAAS